MLSTQHDKIDVSVMIEILQHTIDFEHDLHKKFINAINNNKALDADDLMMPGQKGVTVDKMGNVKIEAGTM
jgi:hypothetical protein